MVEKAGTEVEGSKNLGGFNRTDREGEAKAPHDLPTGEKEGRPTKTIEVSRLPSQGRMYPKGASVRYKAYDFGEIDVYNNSGMTIDQKMKFVLDGLITSFPSDELTLQDFLFVAFLRKISVDSKTKFTATLLCKECGNKLTKDYEAFDLEFDDLEVQPPAKVSIKGGSDELIMVPMTVKGYLELFRRGLLKNKLARYAMQCINIPFDEVFPIINKLSREDGEEVKFADEAMHHDVKALTVTCHHEIDEENEEGEKVKQLCGHKNTVIVEGVDVLISPFRGPEVPVGSRVRFS